MTWAFQLNGTFIFTILLIGLIFVWEDSPRPGFESRSTHMKKEWARSIAKDRIVRLFQLAAEEFNTCPKRSDRYVELARLIGMRYRVGIPKDLKMRFCKNCNCFLVPGRNARVRLKGNYMTTTCLNCSKSMRRPY